MTSRTGQNDLQAFAEPEPLRTWAGQGTGHKCNLCGRPIEPDEIEYEVELAPADSGKHLRFHFRCQQLWEEQRVPRR